jgi:hypothetical protein
VVAHLREADTQVSEASFRKAVLAATGYDATNFFRDEVR